MGLGKTIQAIASMSAFKGDWPLLIIAPSVAKFNWKNELLRWLKLNRNSKKDNNTVLVLNENKIKMLTKEDEDVKGLLKGKQEEVVITSFKIAMKNKTLKAGMFKTRRETATKNNRMHENLSVFLSCLFVLFVAILAMR